MFSRVKECHFDIGLVKQDCWILALFRCHQGNNGGFKQEPVLRNIPEQIRKLQIHTQYTHTLPKTDVTM